MHDKFPLRVPGFQHGLNTSEYVLHAITQCYLFAILLVFPFYFTDQYFNILHDRKAFFQTATMIYLFVSVIALLYFCAKDKNFSIKPYLKLHIPDILLLCFCACTVIGMLYSEQRTSIWTGSEGRYQGIYMWFCYAIAYFLISRFWIPNRLPIQTFLLGSVFSALWGITDFQGMDIFGWLGQIKEEQRSMFSSSYGNINTFTAGIILAMGMSGAMTLITGSQLFVKQNNMNKTVASIWYFFVFVINSTALVCGRSDNAVLGFAAFLLIAVYASLSKKDYLYGLSMICIGLMLTVIGATWNIHIMNNPYIELNDSLLLAICNDAKARSGALLALGVFVIFSQWLARTNIIDTSGLKRIRIAYAALLAASFMPLVLALVVANTTEYDVNKFGRIGKYMRFSDAWGSRRGYIWRATVEEYVTLPPLKQLFGNGLETFGLYMKKHRYQEMLQITTEVFDSPHNEVLQYLFTTGIIGIATLYGWIATTLLCARRNLCVYPFVLAFSAGLVAYFAASLVNISVPITQGLVTVMISMIAACNLSTPEGSD